MSAPQAEPWKRKGRNREMMSEVWSPPCLISLALSLLTVPARRGPSILSPPQLIDPVLPDAVRTPPPPDPLPHTHSIIGINIDYHL